MPATGRRERQGQGLSLAKLEEYDGIIAAIQVACPAQNIPVTTVISEYGAGQFEINLAHQANPLTAADHAALLRRVVQATARELGYDATFMSKPFAGQSGNGLYLHLSLFDDAGRNVFDPALDDGEALLGHAVAGLQASMAEATAVFTPNLTQVLPSYLGERYLKIYAEVKAAEFADFMEEISPREYRWYL